MQQWWVSLFITRICLVSLPSLRDGVASTIFHPAVRRYVLPAVRSLGRGRGGRRCRLAHPRYVCRAKVPSRCRTSETMEPPVVANRRGGRRVMHASYSGSGKTAGGKYAGVRGISPRSLYFLSLV